MASRVEQTGPAQPGAPNERARSGLLVMVSLLLASAFAIVGIGEWKVLASLETTTESLARQLTSERNALFGASHELRMLRAALAPPDEVLAENPSLAPLARTGGIDPMALRDRLSRTIAALQRLSDDEKIAGRGSVASEVRWSSDLAEALRELFRRHAVARDASREGEFRADLREQADLLRSRLDSALEAAGFVDDVVWTRDFGNLRRLVDLSYWASIASLLIALALLGTLTLATLYARGGERRSTAHAARFRDYAETASDWVWDTDAELRLTDPSGAAAEMLGLASANGAMDAGEKRTVIEQLGDAGLSRRQGPRAVIEAMRNRRAFRDIVLEIPGEPGEEGERTFRLSGKPCHGADGLFLGYRGTGTDITIKVRRDRQFRLLADRDHLTKLPTRVSLCERLSRELGGARRTDGMVTLLALDIDGLSDINEAFGHDVGDQVLVAATDRLGVLLREGDVLARLDGDEFGILLGGRARDRDWVAGLADRCIDCLKAPFRIAGRELNIGTSIGIAFYPEHGESVEELLEAADMALCAARADGPSQWRDFDPGMNNELVLRHEIERALRKAIAEGTLEIRFQPQVMLEGAELVGAEALVRWQHPKLGRVPPDLFIGIAEESGLVHDLGAWVLDEACRQAVTWPGGTVAVNVSPAQFARGDIVQQVEDILQQTGLEPSRLVLEITEGVLMRDEEAAIAELARLHEIGVRLAIDDFGTGYSSLSYLKRFPVDEVKIDRSFLRDIETGEGDREIVRAIVSLAHALGLGTIAEGVETTAQAELLRTLDCDQAQGYLYGGPLPGDELRELLTASLHRGGATAADGGGDGKSTAPPISGPTDPPGSP